MGEDEHYSLCWNNFNSNLSAGFHESLCRGDLVDVTLAAEGQIVKAHRLVLSACSPYFRKMFTQMPVNQHAFVFLKDVSHSALKDLIQFIYCGEVNVKQEALPAFISTAEALQIKGLTDSDPPPSQTPPVASTPTPLIQQQVPMPPRLRQRTSTIGRSYKIEAVDDSGDDTKQQTTQIVIQTTAPPHQAQATISTQPPQQQSQQQQQQQQHIHHQQQPSQQIVQQPLQTQTHQITSVTIPTSTTAAVVTHKRPAQRISLGTVQHIKRAKSTIDPLDVAEPNATTQQSEQTTVVTTEIKSQVQQHHHIQQHQTQQHHHQSQPQNTTETEYIDLPIELPTKSEPDYSQEAGEVDQGEQDATYVEDESYGDIRYDESYFTEGEDVGVAANAASGGASNTSATATTSKAIVKQQPLSDSYMDSAGDQGNSDAQGDELLVPVPDAAAAGGGKCVTATGRPKGRPRKEPAKSKTVPIIHKIMASVNSHPGQPILYASTTKGTVKLVVDGHHFRYTFRKGKFTIFQCCYKEGKEECSMRVVTDQKRVYPLDGEHVHFMQATDKSVTSVQFAPGEVSEDAEDQQFIIQNVVNNPEVSGEIKREVMADTIAARDKIASTVHIKLEGNISQEPLRVESESTQVGSIVTLPQVAPISTEEPNEFREKIKKRLQRALLGKKK